MDVWTVCAVENYTEAQSNRQHGCLEVSVELAYVLKLLHSVNELFRISIAQSGDTVVVTHYPHLWHRFGSQKQIDEYKRVLVPNDVFSEHLLADVTLAESGIARHRGRIVDETLGYLGMVRSLIRAKAERLNNVSEMKKYYPVLTQTIETEIARQEAGIAVDDTMVISSEPVNVEISVYTAGTVVPQKGALG